MATDPAARLRESESLDIPVFHTPVSPIFVRTDSQRHHVLNRSMQDKSGRLYFNEEWEFDIPSLELYAAR